MNTVTLPSPRRVLATLACLAALTLVVTTAAAAADPAGLPDDASPLDDFFASPSYEIKWTTDPVPREKLVNASPLDVHRAPNGVQIYCPQISRAPAATGTSAAVAPRATGTAAASKQQAAAAAERESIMHALAQLQTLRDGPCLSIVQAWWRYEYCHDLSVTQSHDMGDKEPPLVYVLGKQDASRSATTAQPADPAAYAVKSAGGRKYLATRYRGGTVCDLTGKPRTIEVRYHCSADGVTRMSQVHETSVCNYLLSLYTPLMCTGVFDDNAAGRAATPVPCHVLPVAAHEGSAAEDALAVLMHPPAFVSAFDPPAPPAASLKRMTEDMSLADVLREARDSKSLGLSSTLTDILDTLVKAYDVGARPAGTAAIDGTPTANTGLDAPRADADTAAAIARQSEASARAQAQSLLKGLRTDDPQGKRQLRIVLLTRDGLVVVPKEYADDEERGLREALVEYGADDVRAMHVRRGLEKAVVDHALAGYHARKERMREMGGSEEDHVGYFEEESVEENERRISRLRGDDPVIGAGYEQDEVPDHELEPEEGYMAPVLLI
ncbi:Protein OS-9 [Blastocladiella emersonii ATCC 22665]|nr:Protein OS-9 [Blastocladiella emersonii ATCC 22665]